MEATRAFAGIDWSWQHHAVCVIDEQGRRLEEVTVAHSAAGLRQIDLLLTRRAVEKVGIERADGPVVEYLLSHDQQVVVISPRQVRSLRARYGAAGNKDDRFDAFVLADALRTDAGRWAPVRSDSPATIGLRMLVRARRDLLGHPVGLREHGAAPGEVVAHQRQPAVGLQREHQGERHPVGAGLVLQLLHCHGRLIQALQLHQGVGAHGRVALVEDAGVAGHPVAEHQLKHVVERGRGEATKQFERAEVSAGQGRARNHNPTLAASRWNEERFALAQTRRCKT